MFMVLQAAVAVLLSRLGAGDDIPMGTAVAGRTDEALDDLVGFFVNTLVMRTDLSGDPTFAELLDRVRETWPGRLRAPGRALRAPGGGAGTGPLPGRHPLFQVMLTLQNTGDATPELAGLTGRSPPGRDAVPANSTWTSTSTNAFRSGGRPAGLEAGSPSRPTCSTTAPPETHGHAVRAGARGGPRRSRPTGRQVTCWDATSGTACWGTGTTRPVDLPSGTVPELFAAQAARTPDAVAVVFEGVEVTYAELDARANRLARLLIGRGVGPESLVAVVMDRSVELVVTLLAVVKAGGAYVPIDPDYPAGADQATLADTGPAAVVTTRSAVRDGFDWVVVDGPRVQTELAGLDGWPVADADRVSPLLPAHPAYVIYTSGSTGRPKGVVVPHAGVVNLLGVDAVAVCAHRG